MKFHILDCTLAYHSLPSIAQSDPVYGNSYGAENVLSDDDPCDEWPVNWWQLPSNIVDQGFIIDVQCPITFGKFMLRNSNNEWWDHR